MSARISSALSRLLFGCVTLILVGGVAVHDCEDHHGDERPNCVLCDHLGSEPPADVVVAGEGDALVLPTADEPAEPPRRNAPVRTSPRGPPAHVS